MRPEFVPSPFSTLRMRRRLRAESACDGTFEPRIRLTRRSLAPGKDAT